MQAGGVDVERCRVTVHGVVQGVGYRWSCLREAERLGVSGEVRNMPDGGVEVVAEGAPEAVDRLIAWCGAGPRHALVTLTNVVAEEPQGITEFRITD